MCQPRRTGLFIHWVLGTGDITESKLVGSDAKDDVYKPADRRRGESAWFMSFPGLGLGYD